MKMFSPRSQGRPVPESDTARGTPALLPPKPPGKGLLRAFTSLRQRNYRLYWFGQMISLIGSRMQTIGQTWLVLELTHSAWQLGLVGALQFLPVLLFSIFGGVFADRWPKRRVLLVTQSAAMIQALLLWALIATGTVQLWHLYILAMLLVGLVLLFGSNFNVVLPLFATDVLHVGARGFGFLSAALGVGSLLSGLWLAWGNQGPTIRRVLIGTLVFGVLEAVFAVSHIYLLSLALIASVGFAETAFA